MLNQNLPKYVAVAEWIKQNIFDDTFKTGDKLMSENQLCERFSISRQTARQAISMLEQEGLIIRKQGSGTYVNNINLSAKQPSKNIGLVTTYLDDYIFPTIISGVEKVLSKNGYNTTIRLTRNKVNNEREQLLSLLKSDIDGLIVEATKSALPNPNIDIYKQFLSRQIPVVFINSYYTSLDCNYVVVDDELGGEMATQYLLDQGHKKITGIFKYDDMQGNLRYKGFLNIMYKNDLKMDESTIIWYSTENMEQTFSEENIQTLITKLKDSTAIVCYNDQIALKLMQLLTHHDIQVPNDLSLVSFDNSMLSELANPAMTSVTHPNKELGKLAADSILKMINNPHYEVKHVFTPNLIIRDSAKVIESE
ncbi:MAG: GntR family transcriptional regulator [Turicibacter sp.]